MDEPPDKQQIHDLLDEANLLYLESHLPTAKTGEMAAVLVARLLASAKAAEQAGNTGGGQSLRQAARLLSG